MSNRFRLDSGLRFRDLLGPLAGLGGIGCFWAVLVMCVNLVFAAVVLGGGIWLAVTVLRYLGVAI